MALKLNSMFLILLTSLYSANARKSPTNWIKKPFIASRGVPINLSTHKLLLKTKAGYGDELRLNFKDDRGRDAGMFILEFSTPAKYGFKDCTSLNGASRDLPTELPQPNDAGYRVFEVEEYGNSGRGLKIICNGVELITFEPSDDFCSGWSFWESTWEKEKTKVTFSFDDVISDYALVRDYRECTGIHNFKLILRGVVTEPKLPLRHGERVLLKCFDGGVNLGGDVGTCRDGVIVPDGAAPFCLLG